METLQALSTDFEFYAPRVLKIKDKQRVGSIVPFVFNRAQSHIHRQLEAQKKSLGYVRAVIVKARQQGCSTYVGGRFYHISMFRPMTEAVILSHESKSTDHLQSIVNTYYDNTPALLKPAKDRDNDRLMTFSNGSRYRLGTAGNESIGRGMTFNLFHGSEVAFWPNTEEIGRGIFNCVPDVAGTEVILESTADGIANLFHSTYIAAAEGKSEYVAIFTPWFWQDEYQKTPPMDFKMDEEERKYADTFGLTEAQMYWRRLTIAGPKCKGDVWKFRAEYPATAAEAFMQNTSSYLPVEHIISARNTPPMDSVGAARILGVDPGFRRDKTGMALREGKVFHEVKEIDVKDPMVLAGILAERIVREDIDMMFIDRGEGFGTEARLHELGFKSKVRGVSFGERPIREGAFLNKRVEMYALMKEWFEEGGTSIPDDDMLQLELEAVQRGPSTAGGLTTLIGKDKIRASLGFSPNRADACALTFAYPVMRQHSLGVTHVVTRAQYKSPYKNAGRVLRCKKGIDINATPSLRW